MVAVLLVVVTSFAAGQNATSTVVVDASERIGPINRGLFSWVNYQYLFAEGTGKALEQFRMLRPEGGQVRIETRFADVEPENDNRSPYRLDEERFFANRGVVYVADGRSFVSSVAREGMEPVLLLAYIAPWLADTGRATGVPTDMDEWLEFAVEIVRFYNDEQRIRYVEVWNEPNIRNYWTGSPEEYFELFNATADALHREFPGIQVGGPATSPSGNWPAYIREFVEVCGDRADFLSYHTYGESVAKIARDIAYFNEIFLEGTGKTGPRVMITESDHRIDPREKFSYLVDRQMALLDLQDSIMGFHHFSLPFYAEGSWVFGLIDTDGTIVPENYWPFWAFNDIRGERVALTVEERGRAIDSGAVAALSREDQTLSIVVDGTAGGARPTEVRVSGLGELSGSGSTDKVAVVFGVSAAGAELLSTEIIDAAAQEWSGTWNVPEAGVLVVDIAGEPSLSGLWLDFSVSEDSLIVGGDTSGTITVTNTGLEPVDGRLTLLGQPEEWDVQIAGGDTYGPLQPGESIRRRVSIDAAGVTPLTGSGVYAFTVFRNPGSRSQRIGSVPVKMKALAPVTLRILPLELHGTPSEATETRVQIVNTFNDTVSGTFSFRLPSGWPGVEPVHYELSPGERVSIEPAIVVPDDTSKGTYPVVGVSTYRGLEFTETVAFHVHDYTVAEGTPVDLSQHFNADLFTGEDKFNDVRNFGGPFSFPRAFFPSDQEVRYLGVPFHFPPTSTGNQNGIRVGGQLISIEPGRYERLSMLVAATNGDKRVSFTLHYADGTRQERAISVTDWCRPEKYAEEEVVERAPYRHNSPGILRDAIPQIMKVDIPTDSGRRLERIEFPDETDFWVIAATLVP